MWDRAPGPPPAESEMEEGSEEEGSERQGAAIATASQLGWVSGRLSTFSTSVSPFHSEENRASPTLLFTPTPPTP